ncbi:MAG: hypothetical protein FWC89_01560 [Defluviitaleaceae bacterium]|nr:hypothetical protein [Defluviitaleaceae bacterium]
MLKKLVFVLLIAACLALVACGGDSGGGGIGIGRSTQTFDVLSHLSVDFSGVDGSGNATVTVNDQNAMEVAMMEAAGFTMTGTLADAAHLADFLILANAIGWEVYPNANLSNGDRVTITLNIDQDVCKRQIEARLYRGRREAYTLLVGLCTDATLFDAYFTYDILNFTISKVYSLIAMYFRHLANDFRLIGLVARLDKFWY